MMRPYQEEYLANIKKISTLYAKRKSVSPSFACFLEELCHCRDEVEQISKRNMQLLRDELFPVLDHMFEADPEELAGLEEFAASLLNDGKELDVGLFCQIHKALLSLARHTKDQKGIIRELYWLGMGYYYLCNKLVGLEDREGEAYTLQMRLCFTEAAAYLKYFDELEDLDTRGYMLRSCANRSLGKFRSAGEKIRMVKRSLEILQDQELQKKEPRLPWDKFIYLTHQQMAASISYDRERTMSVRDISDIMESVYFVSQRQRKEAAERREPLPVRFCFSQYAIEYYCGMDSLDGLLTKMEKLMDAADPEDFSARSAYGIISLPAFYCHYLTDYPEQIPKRQKYIEGLYQRVLDYVDAFPRTFENEKIFYYLRQLSVTFVETEDSISYQEYLQKLQCRFAPQIYVHSWVVGRAAEELCRVIMEEEPSFFDDIPWIREIAEPERKKQVILAYAMECGIYHDAGKLHFMSLYARTPRQWFEEEYEMAHLHTVAGERCLSQRPSTARFAAIALGHHDWYDGSRGYPDSYHRLECPYRQMVDVIGLVDWLDNVTNANYLHTGMEQSFDQALCAAIDLEGRRFSPLLTARLREERIVGRLKKAFANGRKEAYQKLYEESIKCTKSRQNAEQKQGKNSC